MQIGKLNYILCLSAVTTCKNIQFHLFKQFSLNYRINQGIQRNGKEFKVSVKVKNIFYGTIWLINISLWTKVVTRSSGQTMFGDHCKESYAFADYLNPNTEKYLMNLWMNWAQCFLATTLQSSNRKLRSFQHNFELRNKT